MLGQVEIGAVGNAPQLAPAKGEHELNIGGGVGIVGKFFLLMIPQPEVFILDTQIQQEVVAVILPVGEPLQIGARLAEELQLHLLELTGAEDEVARGDLVAEGFSDLGDTEGQLPAGGALDVGKVDKDTLGGLRTQIQFALSVLGDTLEGLEHQVKFADIGKVGGTAVRAFDALFFDEIHHLLVAPAVGGHAGLLLDELIGAMAGFAVLAVHQRVGKTAYMAGSHPHLGIHQDGAVQSHVVGGFLDKFLPPCSFDIVFKLHTQGAIVPGVGKAAVDFAARIDKAAAFAQGRQSCPWFSRN